MSSETCGFAATILPHPTSPNRAETLALATEEVGKARHEGLALSEAIEAVDLVASARDDEPDRFPVRTHGLKSIEQCLYPQQLW